MLSFRGEGTESEASRGPGTMGLPEAEPPLVSERRWRIRARPADVRRGPPFRQFPAAYLLARRHGVPLVVDYRDECTACPFDFVRRDNADLWWERRCLGAAALAIFTTESQRQNALHTFRELSPERALVIHNGWDSDAGPAPESPARGRTRTDLTRRACPAPILFIRSGRSLDAVRARYRPVQ